MGKMDIDIVAAVISLILFIAWLSRLEFKTGINERDTDRLDKRVAANEKKLEELDSRVMDKLSNIEKILTERLAKIEGKLDQ
jgi:cell division protein FtsL